MGCQCSTAKSLGVAGNGGLSQTSSQGGDPLTVIKDTPDGAKGDYSFQDLLGKGSFGNVYRAMHKKTKEIVAIKVMDRQKIKATSIHREWNVLEHIGHHDYVVDYKGTYKTKETVSFVLELMSGGELFDRLIRRGAYLEADARIPFKRVAEGLAYLHKRGIVHRDLKPENILLKDDSDCPVLKIADFGLSQLIGPNERLLKICGTWAYAAPEMSDPSRPGYDCRFDCFSFGVILYVVLSGSHPFDSQGNAPVHEIKARARAAQFDFDGEEWAHISNRAKDLIRRLIVKDPEQRLDSAAMLAHPWFSEAVEPVYELVPVVAGDESKVVPIVKNKDNNTAAGGAGSVIAQAAIQVPDKEGGRTQTDNSASGQPVSGRVDDTRPPSVQLDIDTHPRMLVAQPPHEVGAQYPSNNSTLFVRTMSPEGSGSVVVQSPLTMLPSQPHKHHNSNGNNAVSLADGSATSQAIAIPGPAGRMMGLSAGMMVQVIAAEDGSLRLVPASQPTGGFGQQVYMTPGMPSSGLGPLGHEGPVYMSGMPLSPVHEGMEAMPHREPHSPSLPHGSIPIKEDTSVVSPLFPHQGTSNRWYRNTMQPPAEAAVVTNAFRVATKPADAPESLPVHGGSYGMMPSQGRVPADMAYMYQPYNFIGADGYPVYMGSPSRSMYQRSSGVPGTIPSQSHGGTSPGASNYGMHMGFVPDMYDRNPGRGMQPPGVGIPEGDVPAAGLKNEYHPKVQGPVAATTERQNKDSSPQYHGSHADMAHFQQWPMASTTSSQAKSSPSPPTGPNAHFETSHKAPIPYATNSQFVYMYPVMDSAGNVVGHFPVPSSVRDTPHHAAVLQPHSTHFTDPRSSYAMKGPKGPNVDTRVSLHGPSPASYPGSPASSAEAYHSVDGSSALVVMSTTESVGSLNTRAAPPARASGRSHGDRNFAFDPVEVRFDGKMNARQPAQAARLSTASGTGSYCSQASQQMQRRVSLQSQMRIGARSISDDEKGSPHIGAAPARGHRLPAELRISLGSNAVLSQTQPSTDRSSSVCNKLHSVLVDAASATNTQTRNESVGHVMAGSSTDISHSILHPFSPQHSLSPASQGHSTAKNMDSFGETGGTNEGGGIGASSTMPKPDNRRPISAATTGGTSTRGGDSLDSDKSNTGT